MADDAAETMTRRLRADLKTAMQARRTDEVRVIRALIGAIDNAQAVPTGPGHQPYVERAFGDASGEVPRLRLSAGDVQAVFVREVEERRIAADEMARLAQQDRAEMLRAEAAVVARYLGG
jgi:uncharacterized protein YqeY